MDPRQASRARASQTRASYPTRNGAFNARAAGVCRLKHLRRFALPCGVSGLIWRLRPDGDRPPRGALLRADASR
jgi:hypothetical protein